MFVFHQNTLPQTTRQAQYPRVLLINYCHPCHSRVPCRTRDRTPSSCTWYKTRTLVRRPWANVDIVAVGNYNATFRGMNVGLHICRKVCCREVSRDERRYFTSVAKLYCRDVRGCMLHTDLKIKSTLKENLRKIDACDRHTNSSVKEKSRRFDDAYHKTSSEEYPTE